MTKLLPIILFVTLAGCSTYSPGVPPLNSRGQNMGDVVTTPSGSSFNPASPGAIGGTTSNTGQFTQLAVGASAPTLPGTTGQIGATVGLVCTTNTASCVTQAESGGTQRVMVTMDGSNQATFGNTSDNSILNFNADARIADGSGFARIHLRSNGSANFETGTTIQSAGGTAPTLTAGCNGAGSSVAAGSTNNRGQFTTQTAAATTCTLTWSAAGTWNQAPFCVFSGNLQAIVPPASPGTSTYVITFSSTAAAITENYMCM